MKLALAGWLLFIWTWGGEPLQVRGFSVEANCDKAGQQWVKSRRHPERRESGYACLEIER